MSAFHSRSGSFKWEPPNASRGLPRTSLPSTICVSFWNDQYASGGDTFYADSIACDIMHRKSKACGAIATAHGRDALAATGEGENAPNEQRIGMNTRAPPGHIAAHCAVVHTIGFGFARSVAAPVRNPARDANTAEVGPRKTN